MQFISIEIKSECEKCGNPVMINGPMLTLLCNSCHYEKKIHAMSWKSIIESAIETYSEVKTGEGSQSTTIAGDFNRDVTVIKENPLCCSCGSRLKDIPESVTGKTDLKCSKCNTVNTVAPAPEWLIKIVPQAVLIVNGQSSEADGKKEEPAGKPVFLSCPSCSGNLRVDGSSRLVTCSYCSADVYLPDDLWLRMHPVKTVQKWYLGFNKNDSSMKHKKLNSDLLQAAYDADDDTGIELIENGADINAADHDNRTALFLAAATDAHKLVKHLLKKKADPDTQDSYGTTALNIASYNGNTEIVKSLLEGGADPNIINKVGVTALNAAAKMDNKSIARMLLDHGADPSIANEDGKLPIDRAREEGNNDIVSLIKKYMQ